MSTSLNRVVRDVVAGFAELNHMIGALQTEITGYAGAES